MDIDENDEGLSTPKKVAAGAALGVAIPAAVAVAKKLIGDNDQDHAGSDDADSPTEREAQETNEPTTSTAKQATSKAKSTTRSTAGKTPSATRTRTREQLYKQATRLKIDGRSSMTKAELERAVDRAKKKKASS